MPGAGSLKDNGVAVTAGQLVSAADISAGKLVFSPAANANGAGYASFTFQVQDDGGTANGGVNLDNIASVQTCTLPSVNDAPAGADNTVTTNEDTAYTFAASEVGLSKRLDCPPSSLAYAKITTLPGAGSLKDNGVAVTAGQLVSAADISAGKLVFSPAANANGAGYASFTFQVQDDGVTTNGTANPDHSTLSLHDALPIFNDAPAGADNTVTTNEDTAYTFAAS